MDLCVGRQFECRVGMADPATTDEIHYVERKLQNINTLNGLCRKTADHKFMIS